MHKLMLKFFEFLKNCVQFLKIVAMFLILMLLLYWIKDLADYPWTWLGFVAPLFDFLLNIGESISKGSVNLFSAVFEYKYAIALIILLMLYFTSQALEKFVDYLEELYQDGRQAIRKLEEDLYNKSLAKENQQEQKKINNYQIYVETSIKPMYSRKGFNVNIDEQNELMNKFLIEKTGVYPENFESGFLYSFNSFNKIDNVLNIFAKLPKSKAPINYLICVQIINENPFETKEQIKTVAELKIYNKLITLANTAYRYKFNDNRTYELTLTGVFQNRNSIMEVHSFNKKD